MELHEIEDTLPSVPSKLLRVGIEDFKKVLGDDRYTVDLSVWHVPVKSSPTCAVCVAGAVLAKSLGVPPNKRVFVVDFTRASFRNKLNALDAFRSGIVSKGLQFLYPENLRVYEICDNLGFTFFHVPEFKRDNPKPFIEALEDLAKYLEEVGE